MSLCVYYSMAVQVPVFGAVEPDTAHDGHLRCGFCRVEIIGNLDEFAAVFGDHKTNALNDDFVVVGSCRRISRPYSSAVRYML